MTQIAAFVVFPAHNDQDHLLHTCLGLVREPWKPLGSVPRFEWPYINSILYILGNWHPVCLERPAFQATLKFDKAQVTLIRLQSTGGAALDVYQ
jgi:hypothetical protein